MITTPNPTLNPSDVLFDFGKVIIPTIGLGLVAGTVILAIIAGTPRYCEGGPAHDGGGPPTQVQKNFWSL